MRTRWREAVDRNKAIANCQKALDIWHKTAMSKCWPFPFHLINPDSRVLLYGAGDVGKDFYRQATESKYCKVVLWVDRKHELCQAQGMPVVSPDEILSAEYDQILICAVDETAVQGIENDLLAKYNVPGGKIILYKTT